MVALPNREWVDKQCLLSNASLLTTQALPCGVRGEYPTSQVSFWSTDSATGRRILGLTLETRTINGLAVRIDNAGGLCQTTPNGQCFVDVIVPSESLVVSVATTFEPGLAEIVDSLILLPDGCTTVPSIGSLEPYADVAARLTDAGLLAEPVDEQHAYVVALDPMPGTALAEGSAVRLTTTPYRTGSPPSPS